MELLDLIVDFHKDNFRQGPGSEQITQMTLSEINNFQYFSIPFFIAQKC